LLYIQPDYTPEFPPFRKAHVRTRGKKSETTMSLAALAGVDISDIKLIELNKLDNLPQVNLPNEKLA